MEQGKLYTKARVSFCAYFEKLQHGLGPRGPGLKRDGQVGKDEQLNSGPHSVPVGPRHSVSSVYIMSVFVERP